MNSQEDIQTLADAKLRAAECLFLNGMYDQAFYLGGYMVELLLKAKVCKTLDVSDFFLFKRTKKLEIYKPYKSHDYHQLLLLSGLYSEFETFLNNDVIFKGHWSVVSAWDENSRYLTDKTEKDVQIFIISLKEVSKWIKKHL